MSIDLSIIFATILNILLLGIIVVCIYRAIKSYKAMVSRSKEMDKNIKIILSNIEKDKRDISKL